MAAAAVWDQRRETGCRQPSADKRHPSKKKRWEGLQYRTTRFALCTHLLTPNHPSHTLTLHAHSPLAQPADQQVCEQVQCEGQHVPLGDDAGPTAVVDVGRPLLQCRDVRFA